ncbi:hypothetical protein A0U40_03090 [[Bacillus] sp. KCTC 13219]|nr:hypothetical protein A0U40_03090 [[Bacillus] sp. KCTC 13219]
MLEMVTSSYGAMEIQITSIHFHSEESPLNLVFLPFSKNFLMGELFEKHYRQYPTCRPRMNF